MKSKTYIMVCRMCVACVSHVRRENKIKKARVATGKMIVVTFLDFKSRLE